MRLMKQLLLALFLMIMMNIQAQETWVEKEYHFNHPQIKTQNGNTEIYFQDTRIFGETGKASLPFHRISLLLPPGTKAADIQIIYKNEIDLEGEYKLLPRQEARPISSKEKYKFLENKSFYRSSQIYPQQKQAEVSTQYFSGYAIAGSAFTPLRYIPSSGKVSYYSTVKVRVKAVGSDEAQQALQNLPYKEKNEIIDKITDNPGEISYYPVKSSRSESYDYLIITGNDFVSEFDSLIRFYESYGIKTKIYSLSYIDTAETGQDMQEKIRNFIISQYQDNGIEYVMLGGDAEVVPYRGFYCYVDSGSGYTDYNIPSDLYYSALDGNWNSDGDDMWAEPGEDDLYPEVAVGRLPFSDTTELHHMLHKSMSYQSAPVTGELNKPLLAGEYLYNNPLTWGADYMDLLVGDRNDNGYSSSGIPIDHPYDTLYDRPVNYNWNKYDLINLINQGTPFIHHCGHASATYMMRMYNGDITDANFSQVNGIDHNYPVLYTHGCICGAFDVSDCIAEWTLKIQNYASAFVGNSRYGWFVEGTTDGPSEHLHREFVNAMYGDSINHLGMTHMISKFETAPFVPLSEYEQGATRWCFYDNNVLGDPMMALWTNEPESVSLQYLPLVPAGSGHLEITALRNNALAEGLTCVVMKNDTLLGSAITNSSGYADIQLEEPIGGGNYRLYISGYNILKESHDLTVADLWLGYSKDWNDPQNWYSNSVPGSNTNVYVPLTPEGGSYPLISDGGTFICHSMYLEPGAQMHMKDGNTIEILGE